MAPKVRIRPAPSGRFLDGIPTVEQEVSAEDAEWMIASGAFVAADSKPEKPAPPPEPAPAEPAEVQED